MQVGITGGIGAGKSIVCKIFKVLGIECYDADSRARSLMESDLRLKAKIQNLFGWDSFSEGRLQRGFISQMVFRNPDKLKKLNKAVHPFVARDFKDWSDARLASPYVIKEAALLVETGSYKELDKLILVRAPEKLKISRILQRDPQRGEDQIKAIMSKQLQDEEKLKVADFVIENDEKTPLISQVLEIHDILKQK